MEDIEQATAAVVKTAGEIGMTRDQLGKTKDLLQRYGDERERLLEQMAGLIGGTDTEGVSDNWKNCSEKGSGLLESLNGAVPNSPNGEGLNGVGLNDFYQGEKKVWDANSKGQVSLVAEVISKVRAANVGLIDECNEELNSIREANGEVESTIAQNLEEIKRALGDLSQTLTSKLNDKTIATWMKEGGARDYIKAWSESLLQRLEEIFKAAQEKSALKKKIIDRVEVLGNAREQLDEPWIDEMYRTGEDGAKSLAGVGETGGYRAADWSKFGESCIEPLGERRDAAKEQAKTLFGEILPTYTETGNTSFTALTNDPSKVETWKSDIQDQTSRINESLASEQELIDDLADGPFKQASGETFTDVKDAYTSAMKTLLERIRDAEDLLKG